MIGRMFDVKEFAVHDGPGARVTFFLKGCPLRCPWCHNPEGQRSEQELMIRTALCTDCGRCRRPSETELFRRYGRNPLACPKGLITEAGTDVTARQILDRVLPLKQMLESMGGGVTFSGGEPLLQWEFLCECLSLLRENGIHTAVETCGYAEAAVFRSVMENCDYILMDLKIFDPEAHLAATGVENGPILENARILKQSGRKFVFRTPLIPGYTDSPENLAQIRAFVGDSPWESLPYNDLAGAKYPMLGREYTLNHSERNDKI